MSGAPFRHDKAVQTDPCYKANSTQTDPLALFARLTYVSVNRWGQTCGLVEFPTLSNPFSRSVRTELLQSQRSQSVEPHGTSSELVRSGTGATQLYRTASSSSTRVDASSAGHASSSGHGSSSSGVHDTSEGSAHPSQSSTSSTGHASHLASRHDASASSGDASDASDMDCTRATAEI